jgi:hypothetical protein
MEMKNDQLQVKLEFDDSFLGLIVSISIKYIGRWFLHSFIDEYMHAWDDKKKKTWWKKKWNPYENYNNCYCCYD